MLSSVFTFIAEAPAPTPPSSISTLIPMLCIFAVFYVLLIRPQQKRQKELQTRISNLKTGDKVVTNGGIHGIVSNVKDGPSLILKIADNVKIEVDKSAIAVIDSGEAPAKS